MKTSNYLEVINIYKFHSNIIGTKTINDNIYVCDDNNIYKLDDEAINIEKEKKLFLNAYEIQNNIVYSFQQSYKDEKDLIYTKNSFDSQLIDLKHKNIKDIYLFQELDYYFILLEDNSFDVYNLHTNLYINNIDLSDSSKRFEIIKSSDNKELVILLDDKIKFFDIITLNISRIISINTRNILKVVYDKDLYLIEPKSITVFKSCGQKTKIDINIKEDIVNVSSNSDIKDLFFITKSNNIYYFHMQTLSLFKVLNDVKDIVDIKLLNEYLFCISDDLIIRYDTTKGVMEFEKLLILKEYEKAFEILKNNPFIFTDNYFMTKIEKVWNEEYALISNKLFMNKKDDAEKIFEKFSFIDKYNNDFTELLDNSQSFVALAKALRTLDFEYIFTTMEKKKIINKTPIGIKILNDWENSFNEFTTYLLKNKFDEKAKEYQVIKKYEKALSKKTLIETVIRKQDIVLSCINAFKSKNYALYSNLLTRNSFLKKLPLIKKLRKYANNIYAKIDFYIQNENFDDATSLVKSWFYLCDSKENAYLLEEKINILASFTSSLQKGRFSRCRTLFEQYENHFINTKYYDVILNIDNNKITSALDYLLAYQFEQSYVQLQELFKSKIWSRKIFYIMIVYYRRQFEVYEDDYSSSQLNSFIDRFYEIFSHIDERFFNIREEKNQNINFDKKITFFPKELL